MPYSNEYLSHIKSPVWLKKSRGVRNLTQNMCIVFPWLKAREAHHMHYRNLSNELPIRDVVPLSKTAHKLVHLPLLWRNKKVTKWVNCYLRIVCVFSIIFWNTIGLVVKFLVKK